MADIPVFEGFSGERRLAILDNSSIDFMEGLERGVPVTAALMGMYDLILIPGWVMLEIDDSAYRKGFIEKLNGQGYPVRQIAETAYTGLAERQEGHLLQIVKAAVSQIAELKSYVARNIERSDPLDLAPFEEWIVELYEHWPSAGTTAGGVRSRKKNAGEVSIVILASILSRYSPSLIDLTVYSQDTDTYVMYRRAEELLTQYFKGSGCVSVSFQSNDGILCRLLRETALDEAAVRRLRRDEKRIEYVIHHDDGSHALRRELAVPTEKFLALTKLPNVSILF